MNEKEISEIRRRFRADKSNITHVRGCYVNEKQEIVSQFDQPLSLLPQEECENMLSVLRRTLSGTLGKNLIEMSFTTAQVVDSDEHRLLMALRDSKLTDEEAAIEDMMVTMAEYGDEIAAESQNTKPHITDNKKDGKEQSNIETFPKHNFHYNLWELETGGAKTRYQWNVDAIRTLKQIEEENRLATMAEQKILARYAGWGGIPEVFDEKNSSWEKQYKELKELLSPLEYENARASVNNAFYTSPEIAMCINQKLADFGVTKGNILEPSMGIGNFFGSMPIPMQSFLMRIS